jgi:hypothetical protein
LIGDKSDDGRGEIGAGAGAARGEGGAGGREDAWDERVDVGREEVIKADSVVMPPWGLGCGMREVGGGRH